MLCLMGMACKRVSVDFTYSPQAPRAGQQVAFTNLSSSGEEWNWVFGSGATSTLKSPTYVYRQPGTYRVTLQVDNKSSLTATKEITIYDTIPTFECADSTFTVFTDYTFKAVVYNPYNYDITYEWNLPANTIYAVVTDTTFHNSTLHLYFTQPMSAAPVALTVIMNEDTTYIEKNFDVQDRATHAILFRTAEADYRQRIFGEKAESYKVTEDKIDSTMLADEQDTVQNYFGREFKLSELTTVFPSIEGFRIASRKIYFRANGLWVAHLDGTDMVQIDSKPCKAMNLDTKDNRIYWANDEGIWHMPLVGSDNNKFITVPKQLNTLKANKITIDYEEK